MFLEILVPSVIRVSGMKWIVPSASECRFHDRIAYTVCYITVHSSTVKWAFNYWEEQVEEGRCTVDP